MILSAQGRSVDAKQELLALGQYKLVLLFVIQEIGTGNYELRTHKFVAHGSNCFKVFALSTK